ncbi:LON peptidase substrate-binding domain-containing protein [Colwellia echini]|uniref:Lon N-terminal domain-containing protein n=1 Tax=Colwellia echini TaxID=1982103 RepID=A0ABY3MYA4_9GAMM|nr:LON peptidase substrate-binding domain-containing protein [Colwellia echini]TYK66211.1 hypothetical protein CWS31_006285 [Colwellia echini]
MNKIDRTLPIFPLPIFLLPEGITRLRIFEQRYLKMIKIASKGQGFVIWLNSQESSSPLIKWGSWVEIINFDLGDDGVLEVDVKCKSLVDIISLNKDEDNLHFGVVNEKLHWSQNKSVVEEIEDEKEHVKIKNTDQDFCSANKLSKNTISSPLVLPSNVSLISSEQKDLRDKMLAEPLNELFSNDLQLNKFYPANLRQNPHWVVARWLEILPLNLSVKSTFVNIHSFEEAKNFVQSVINK